MLKINAEFELEINVCSSLAIENLVHLHLLSVNSAKIFEIHLLQSFVSESSDLVLRLHLIEH